MTKLRLFLWSDCNRSCEGCCNKDWDIAKLPVYDGKTKYDSILLTGGEPLLNWRKVCEIVTKLNAAKAFGKIILYTADQDHLINVINYFDGVTLTLHTQEDADDFYLLDGRLKEMIARGHLYTDKHMLRLNVFKGITVKPSGIWNVKYDMEWIKDCPLPEGEVFMRYE